MIEHKLRVCHHPHGARIASDPASRPPRALRRRGAGPPAVADGPGRYELLGFISHMGASTACGHYVAHLRRGGRWVIFNDDKVAASAQPPRDLGYLYLFRRADVPAPA